MLMVSLVGGVVVVLVLVGMMLRGRSFRPEVARAGLRLVSRFLMVVNLTVVIGVVAVPSLYAQEASAPDTHLTTASTTSMGYGMGLWAAAIAVAVGALGGGIAVGMAASAGMGALSENPKLFGNILIFVGLAEGIAIYGLVVALFILQKL